MYEEKKEFVKTNKQLWEEVERQNLENALNADPGSEEGKNAFKQATEARSVLNEEGKIESGEKESKRKMAVDIIKCAGFGLAAFVGQVILRKIDKETDRELMEECMRWETGDETHDAQMFSTTPGKQVKNRFFRKR